MEESSEALLSRCWKFYKGCGKHTEGLGEAYDGDIAFASALENFGGGHNDPLFVTLGGISTFKELLRSQVEHMLNDRLLNILNVEILDVKEARRRFEKASLVYDQAREKFMSLRKSTKTDVVTVIEEELNNARTSFDEARFNLVSALHNVEAKKRFEFLEAVTGVMDAHLDTFNRDIIYYMRWSLSLLRISNNSSRCSNRICCKWKGISGYDYDVSLQVRIIRTRVSFQTFLQLRADWKRRYFVLDSRGMLYYYRKPWNGLPCWNSESIAFFTYHGVVHDDKSVARHTVNLLTSTIKMDAEQQKMPWTRWIGSKDNWCNYFLVDCTATGKSFSADSESCDWDSASKTDDSVRSLTLDVKIWDSSVLTMFQSLGNLFANSVWEELLHSDNSSKANKGKLFHARKPEHDDPISLKESMLRSVCSPGEKKPPSPSVAQQAYSSNKPSSSSNSDISKSRTPLHYCIMRGKNAAVKVLIARGANPVAADKEGNTPLNLAPEPGNVGKDILALLSSSRWTCPQNLP
ncbi:Pleckstrin-like proteiny domain [Sesbania bispinosa]|nr:Pleckstrin-like proteiny domain [Sesbania bispinosa]